MALDPQGDGLQGSTVSVGLGGPDKGPMNNKNPKNKISSRVVILEQALKGSPAKPGSQTQFGL